MFAAGCSVTRATHGSGRGVLGGVLSADHGEVGWRGAAGRLEGSTCAPARCAAAQSASWRAWTRSPAPKPLLSLPQDLLRPLRPTIGDPAARRGEHGGRAAAPGAGELSQRDAGVAFNTATTRGLRFRIEITQLLTAVKPSPAQVWEGPVDEDGLPHGQVRRRNVRVAVHVCQRPQRRGAAARAAAQRCCTQTQGKMSYPSPPLAEDADEEQEEKPGDSYTGVQRTRVRLLPLPLPVRAAACFKTAPTRRRQR